VKPRLLDLFCGAGGCTKGYQRAGFYVVGVDNRPQPHYCGDEFYQADAMTFPLEGFDAIHASPPCQRYTKAAKIHNSADRHPDLVEFMRFRLNAAGVPWVMENVIGAPLQQSIVLCGTMFGLKVFRHRLFESNLVLLAPPHSVHDGSTGASDGMSTRARGRNGYICVAGHNYLVREGAEAMGIDWPMTGRELSNAIPPAYTFFIGKQLLAALAVDDVTADSSPSRTHDTFASPGRETDSHLNTDAPSGSASSSHSAPVASVATGANSRLLARPRGGPDSRISACSTGDQPSRREGAA
jgi:DNA (cytosine-5)-methyltransferase 1